MKKIGKAFMIMLLAYNVSAQTNSNFTEAELKSIQQEVNAQAKVYQQQLLSTAEDTLRNRFTVDTFKIEYTLRLKMDKNPSTHGMLEAMNDANTAYDKMLNHYYQLLLKKMKSGDKVYLINAQKAWIQFRDEDEKLLSTLHGDAYTGGGTMYQLSYYSALLQRVQQRAIEVFLYYENINI
ncbi:MAG: DUF1311 domain-containing protein [Bacteroidetes bacterium]|nr:DUF1311 domain-containing protein [Bacteroidota bacterium]